MAIEQQVKIVVIGLHAESRAAETLVREIRGQLVRLDTIGNPEDHQKNSFLNLMKSNANTLARALCEPQR
jgi:ABC-type Zn uptake system ZnuABC Zn-binding protein ZnuA